MKRVSAVIMLIALFLLLNCLGCVRSYVDPAMDTVVYTDLRIRQNPQPIRVLLEFQTLGVPNLIVSETVLPDVESILHASNLFTQVLRVEPMDESMDQLHITINNTATLESALGNISNTAVGTFSLGQAEAMVTDHYNFSANYRPVGGQPVRVTYHHAIHSTAGKPVGLQGAEPLEPDVAFERLLENMLLKMLNDLQQQGYLQ